MKKLILIISMVSVALMSYAQTVQITSTQLSLYTTEGVGTYSIGVTMTGFTTAATVDVELLHGNTTSADVILTTAQLSFSANGEQMISLTISEDMLEESDEYFFVRLKNPVNATVGTRNAAIVIVDDNDNRTMSESSELTFTQLPSFFNPNDLGVDGSGDPLSSLEISAYNPANQRIYSVNSKENYLEIFDISNIATTGVTRVNRVSLNSYGGLNSIAINPVYPHLAIAVENTTKTNNGSILFTDLDGNFITQVAAGALPDMVTFTPNGLMLLAANEGEPNSNYSIDPEGSVTVVNVPSGNPANIVPANHVQQVDFQSFNGTEAMLRSNGVRIYGNRSAATSNATVNATAAQDLEPEYICISSDGTKAYVVCQENNAYITLNLSTANNVTVTSIQKLPTINLGASTGRTGFDFSDQSTGIHLINLPVYAYAVPDGSYVMNIGGEDYLFTANEGDLRADWGATNNEEIRYSSNSYIVDNNNNSFVIGGDFNWATFLKRSDVNLFRRSQMLLFDGDTDQDGDIDQLHKAGSRGFTIIRLSDNSLVYSSGDGFERATMGLPYFNASNTRANFASKNRSDDKGPEPEGIVVAQVGSQIYAFIALERTGGVIVYNVTDPEDPYYVAYENNRTTPYTQGSSGDLGAEGILFIAAEDSPTGKAMIVTSNEISNSLGFFEITYAGPTADGNAITATPTLVAYPNPASEVVTFSKAIVGTVTNLAGVEVAKVNGTELNVSSLVSGLYIVKTNEGEVIKISVK